MVNITHTAFAANLGAGPPGWRQTPLPVPCLANNLPRGVRQLLRLTFAISLLFVGLFCFTCAVRSWGPG